jgi:mannitol/fructose-specific phosphotransferase system IIA component (Ntr-type)
MRESRIKEYDPGFKSPWYPWIQIAGIILSIILIFEMGVLSILFTLAVSVASIVWYRYYAEENIERQGAIFHIHARLGENKDHGLESEMRGILREKGLRQEDPYEELVSRADVLEFDSDADYNDIFKKSAESLAEKLNITVEELRELFMTSEENSAIQIADGVALNHARLKEDVSPELVLVRIRDGYSKEKINKRANRSSEENKLHSIIFFVSSEEKTGQHLRILAHIAEMVGSKSFLQRWIAAENEEEIKEILLCDERFIKITLNPDDSTQQYIGKMIKEISFPGQSLITIIKRNGEIKIPHGITVLQEDDELSIIGEVEDINELKNMLNK